MFRHVREVVRVLTYKPTSEEVSAAADVVFVSEPSEPPPKISLAIIAALEALVFAFIFGYLSAFLAKLVLPEKPVASVGVIGGAAVLVLRVLGDRHLHSLGAKVKLRLRIGERLAPYFGRRMERTYRVLRDSLLPHPKQRVVPTRTDKSGTTAPPITTQQKVRVWMQVVVSLIILVVALLMLTSPNPVLHQTFDEGMKRFAAGWIGAVIGYWLS